MLSNNYNRTGQFTMLLSDYSGTGQFIVLPGGYNNRAVSMSGASDQTWWQSQRPVMAAGSDQTWRQRKTNVKDRTNAKHGGRVGNDREFSPEEMYPPPPPPPPPIPTPYPHHPKTKIHRKYVITKGTKSNSNNNKDTKQHFHAHI